MLTGTRAGPGLAAHGSAQPLPALLGTSLPTAACSSQSLLLGRRLLPTPALGEALQALIPLVPQLW